MENGKSDSRELRQVRAPSLSEDLVGTIPDIAEEIGESVRRTQYMAETHQIPAFKIGNRWYLRKSTFRAMIEERERAAIKEVEAVLSKPRLDEAA